MSWPSSSTTTPRGPTPPGSDLRPYHRPGTPPPSDGDLARATLSHLAITRPQLGPVIDRATRLADDDTRFEPAMLALGGLVPLALHTEIKIQRSTTGEWRHKCELSGPAYACTRSRARSRKSATAGALVCGFIWR